MKKGIIIFLVTISVIITGCRSRSNMSTNNSKNNNKSEPKEEITLELGNESYTFNAEEQKCGSHQIQSNVVFSNEKDEEGNFKGSYALYECNEDNVNLETASGTYKVDDLDVTFIDSYGQELEFEITSDDTVTLKDGSKNSQTFTK